MSRSALRTLPLLLLAACSSISANDDYDRQADFSAYETFALAPLPEASPELPGYDEILGRRMEGRIVDALQTAGLEQVQGDEHDLLVHVTLDGQQRVDMQMFGYGWGPTMGRVDEYERHYMDGTLVIDLVDSEKKQVVWHGYASAELNDYSDGAELALEAVTKIMSRYPPRE